MKKTKFKLLARVSPLSLFVFIFIFDLFTNLSQLIVNELMIIRDLVFILGFLLLIPVLSKMKLLSTKAPYDKIKQLFLCIFGMYFTLFFVQDSPAGSGDFFLLQGSVRSLIISTISSLFSVVFGVATLLKLKELILIRRKRGTERNFWTFIVLMAVMICYSECMLLASGREANSITDLMFDGVAGKIILAVLIMFIVINSFRNSWISYLTKKQKIRSLFFSFVFGVAPIIFYNQFNTPMIRFSLAFETFLSQLGLFLSIYWTMAAVVILFHLPTAGIVDRKMTEIRSFRDLSGALSTEFDFSKLIQKISELSIEVTGANATYLQILDPKSRALRLAASKNLGNLDVTWLNENPNASVGRWVVESREAVWVNSVTRDERVVYLKKWRRRFESIIAVPLLSYDKILGVLCVLKTQEYGFIPEDLDLMQTFADSAAIAMENSRLVRESIEKERLEQELKVAHDAQMKLLPKSTPRIDGLDIDAICVTANEVGGDYYDFFLFDEDTIGIVVGDVSGKGAQAAFYMAEVKGIIKSLSQIYRSPREVLTKANDILCDSFDRRIFVSLIYAIIDKKKREMVFSRAGHCPLLMYQCSDGSTQFIEPRGIGVGLAKGDMFGQLTEEKRLPIASGDTMLFFTDGVVEARNRAQAEFEEDSLKRIFSNLVEQNSTEIKNKLVGELRTFVGATKTHDDLTMVVVKVGEPVARRGKIEKQENA